MTGGVLLRAVLAFVITSALAPVVLKQLRRAGVLDHSTERSSHSGAVPRGGGIAPAAGALVALAVAPYLEGDRRWGLIVAVGAFGALGLVEDVAGVRPLYRLVLQVAAGGLAGLFLLGDLSGPALWQIVFAAGVVLWLVAFVNAYNFMDGIDGISVAQAVVAGVTWFAVGLWGDSPAFAAGGAIVVGAALGFAPYNMPRAHMFLGDVGSYAIGAWLAALAVIGVRDGLPPEAVLAPLALYAADTGTTLVRRAARKEHLCVAHREHAYQRLVGAGWSHVRVTSFVACCIAACATLGAVSMAGSLPARIAADLAIAGIVGAYLRAPKLLGRRRTIVDGDGAMRVLVVCHYFPPEIGAPQARVSELARSWTEVADDVTVLTGMPNHPTGVVPAEYRRRLRVTEKLDGYNVVRTWLYATPNTAMLKKTIGHLSFMVTSVVLGLRPTGRAEVVVVSSPTFFSVFSAWVLARVKRAAFVVEVRDLWPAIFVELGVLRNQRIIRLLEMCELAAYRAADAVVVVTEGFRDDLVRRGVPSAKVFVVPNGADLDRFAPLPPTDEARAELGAAPGDALVLYIGAHGISHGLEAVAAAAAKLIGEPVHFAFVGDGAAKAELEARVTTLGLSNVTLLPAVTRRDVPRLLAAADICLVPLRDVPLFASFIPSKMFEYLAAEKAVIGSVRGEPAKILLGAGAVVVEPENAGALADAVRDLAGDPDRRRRMGRQGREYVGEHFDRRELAGRYRSILAGVVHP